MTKVLQIWYNSTSTQCRFHCIETVYRPCNFLYLKYRLFSTSLFDVYIFLYTFQSAPIDILTSSVKRIITFRTKRFAVIGSTGFNRKRDSTSVRDLHRNRIKFGLTVIKFVTQLGRLPNSFYDFR